MTTKTTKLKCRFCGALVNRWKTDKNGKKIDGFDTMRDHIEIYHGDEAEKMGWYNE